MRMKKPKCNFGFKSPRTSPQNNLLKAFEDELYDMIQELFFSLNPWKLYFCRKSTMNNLISLISLTSDIPLFVYHHYVHFSSAFL